MKTKFSNISDEIKSFHQWVVWRNEENPSNPDKPKKRPIDPKTEKPASVTDPDTWGTYKQAVNCFKQGKVDGIGFVFTKKDPYVGTDLDKCRDKKTGMIEPWAQEIIDSFNSYTEVSPSGTGVHIILKGRLSGKGKKIGNIEIYDDGRYFTFSGNHMTGTPLTIKRKQAKINEFYANLLKPKEQTALDVRTAKPNAQCDYTIIAKVLQSGNGDKFSKLLNGDWQSVYNSQSEADLAFCSFLSKLTDSHITIDRIFRGSGLMREKWDVPHGEHTYGDQTITRVLNNPNTAYGITVSKETSQFEIAQQVIKQVGRENIFSYANKFFIWDQKGIWRTPEDREIKKLIHEIAHHNSISRSQIDSILDLIKTEVHTAKNLLGKNNRRVINCLNGELHYEDGEWVLKPHNRKSYFVQQIPVKYNKKALRKRFWRFLNQIFSPDPDRTEKIKLLQEIIGYALIRSCEYERFLMLVGNGANGKSVILKLIIALLGPNNVAGVQPSQLENRFQLAHLQGKLANVITEIPQGSVIADAKLKALVSGELMTAEHKFGKPFDFEPYATMFFATNHLPHTKDFSKAFFRRAEILTFNRDFKGQDCDPTLKDELPKDR